MKSKISAAVLTAMLATNGAFAWSLFGNSGIEEKPDFDYSKEEEAIRVGKQHPEIIKRWKDSGSGIRGYQQDNCDSRNGELACLAIQKKKLYYDLDLEGIKKFYEDTLQKECYEKKFAPACSLPYKEVIEGKNDIKGYPDEIELGKKVLSSKSVVKMLDYGCKELKDYYACKRLRLVYEMVGDEKKAEQYKLRVEDSDKRWFKEEYSGEGRKYYYNSYSMAEAIIGGIKWATTKHPTD